MAIIRFVFFVSIFLAPSISYSQTYTYPKLVGEWKQVKIEILEVEGDNEKAIAEIREMYREMTEDRKNYILETLTFSPDSTCVFKSKDINNNTFIEIWSGKTQINGELIEIINSASVVNGTLSIGDNYIYWDCDITRPVASEYGGISKFITKLTFERIII